jgi:hypothetical protein
MQLSNLIFFDKFGENYNFQTTKFNSETQKSDAITWWYGREYISPISIGLYDSRQIFAVEKDSTNYKFPILAQNERIVFKWETLDLDGAQPFFLYVVKQDITGNSVTELPYIERVNQVTLNHSDFSNGSSSPLDINLPLQVNIAFSPAEEKIYQRKLLAYHEILSGNTVSSSVKILEIDYYGEGLDEDSRYRLWLNNFGISFHRDDAQLLKDYDIKEALPDWQQIDQARKELLVNRDQVFPYVGTYKGLSNFINLFGYKDTLDVKEFWQNVNNSSAALDQFALVNITDFLDDGKIDNMVYVSNGGAVLESAQFKKTSFIALCYQFTKASNNYDDDGLPEVVETTDFTPAEIFYKLDGLAKKVKREILPIHVIVRDIIGEFIFFEKFNIRYWTDDVQTRSIDVNTKVKASIELPSSTIAVPYVRDIRPIYYSVEADSANPAKILNGFPKYSFNTGKDSAGVFAAIANPYSDQQKYSAAQQKALLKATEVFYQQVQAEEWKRHGSSYYWANGEVNVKEQLGCPIILKAELPKYRIMDYDGITFGDLETEGARVRDIITYLNLVDAEWTITKNAPNPYKWNFRGTIYDFNRIVHFLPYVGDYLIELRVYDQFAGISVDFIKFTVKPTVATTVGFTRTSDKFSYQFKDLTNVTVGDMGGSYMFNPNVTIPSFTQKIGSIDLEKELFDWAYYSNNFSNNTAPTQAKIKDKLSGEFKLVGDPTLVSDYAYSWGLGENSVKPRMSDISNAKIGDLFHTKFYQLSYQSDFLQGFSIDAPTIGHKIRLGLHDPYTVPTYSTIDNLITQLNASTHSAISKFRYKVVNNKVYATAKESSNTNNFTVKVTPN